MSGTEIIHELCGICAAQSAIIAAQSDALHLLSAECMETEVEEVRRRLAVLAGGADRCVCCGEPVPEGRMVCPACERGGEI